MKSGLFFDSPMSDANFSAQLNKWKNELRDGVAAQEDRLTILGIMHKNGMVFLA